MNAKHRFVILLSSGAPNGVLPDRSIRSDGGRGNETIDVDSLGSASLESNNSYALGVNRSHQVVRHSYSHSLAPRVNKGPVSAPPFIPSATGLCL